MQWEDCGYQHIITATRQNQFGISDDGRISLRSATTAGSWRSAGPKEVWLGRQGAEKADDQLKTAQDGSSSRVPIAKSVPIASNTCVYPREYLLMQP